MNEFGQTHCCCQPPTLRNSLLVMDPYGGGFLMGHTGNGGMTTSLAMGVTGSAADRRAAQYPLSPVLNNGRSALSSASGIPLCNPRDGTFTTSSFLQQTKNEQWTSRTRPVFSEGQISAQIQADVELMTQARR